MAKVSFKETLNLMGEVAPSISIKGAFVTLSKKGNLNFKITTNTQPPILVFEKNNTSSGQFMYNYLKPGEYIFTFYNNEFWGKSELLYALHLEGNKEIKASSNSTVEHLTDSDIMPTHEKLVLLSGDIARMVVHETLYQANSELQYKSIRIT